MPCAYAHRVRALTCTRRAGETQRSSWQAGQALRPQSAGVSGSPLGSLQARLPVGAVASTVEVLARLRCVDALGKRKDEDGGWLPGG